MMRKINSTILFVFFYIFIFGQEKDNQSWNTISVDKEISNKINISIKESFRVGENYSFLYKYFTDTRLKYNYNNNISLAIGFRYINEREEDDLDILKEKKYRYYTDFSVKKSIDRTRISLRNRFQRQGDSTEYKNTIRQKISINYDIKKSKIKPITSVEYFYRKDEKINKIRFSLGLEYPITKQLELYLGYRKQKETKGNNPLTINIIELKLNYNIK